MNAGPRGISSTMRLTSAVATLLACTAAGGVFAAESVNPVAPATTAAAQALDVEFAIKQLKLIVAAEIQFQAGNYVDGDKDGKGSYGFIQELAGATKGKGNSRLETALALLPKEYSQEEVALNGWQFTVGIPGATDKAGLISTAVEAEATAGKNEDKREQDFVAFALPAKGAPGQLLVMLNCGKILKKAEWPGGKLVMSEASMKGLKWLPDYDAAWAATQLKSGLFPSEVQFQAGGYVDSDDDGRGSYGLVSELAGGTKENGNGRNSKALSLLPPEFAIPDAIVHDWQFAVVLPGEEGNHSSASSIKELKALGTKGENNRESYWTGYAWRPKDAEGVLLAITHSGVLYVAGWDGSDPRLLTREMIDSLIWKPTDNGYLGKGGKSSVPNADPAKAGTKLGIASWLAEDPKPDVKTDPKPAGPSAEVLFKSFKVGMREATFGKTQVIVIENISATPEVVKIVAKAKNGDTKTFAEVKVPAKGKAEIGHMEGWKGALDDTVEVTWKGVTYPAISFNAKK